MLAIHLSSITPPLTPIPEFSDIEGSICTAQTTAHTPHDVRIANHLFIVRPSFTMSRTSQQRCCCLTQHQNSASETH